MDISLFSGRVQFIGLSISFQFVRAASEDVSGICSERSHWKEVYHGVGEIRNPSKKD